MLVLCQVFEELPARGEEERGRQEPRHARLALEHPHQEIGGACGGDRVKREVQCRCVLRPCGGRSPGTRGTGGAASPRAEESVLLPRLRTGPPRRPQPARPAPPLGSVPPRRRLLAARRTTRARPGRRSTTSSDPSDAATCTVSGRRPRSTDGPTRGVSRQRARGTWEGRRNADASSRAGRWHEPSSWLHPEVGCRTLRRHVCRCPGRRCRGAFTFAAPTAPDGPDGPCACVATQWPASRRRR